MLQASYKYYERRYTQGYRVFKDGKESSLAEYMASVEEEMGRLGLYMAIIDVPNEVWLGDGIARAIHEGLI